MLKLKAKILEIFKSASHEKSPEAEADLILFHAFRTQNPKLHNLGELRSQNLVATPEVSEEALRIAEDRAKGIPLQHILGHQFFFEHEYLVDDSTLIPRPETEILISEILDYLKNHFAEKPFRFAELGLGSGILSAEILARFKNASGVASEINPLAIALARQNLEKIIGPDFDKRFSILEPGSELGGFEVFSDSGPFDVVISNPPYVSRSDEIEKEVLNYEPHQALFPLAQTEVENPNYFYENFISQKAGVLKKDGAVFFEVPHERALKILVLFQKAGFRSIKLVPDLTGRHRVLQANF